MEMIKLSSFLFQDCCFALPGNVRGGGGAHNHEQHPGHWVQGLGEQVISPSTYFHSQRDKPGARRSYLTDDQNMHFHDRTVRNGNTFVFGDTVHLRSMTKPHMDDTLLKKRSNSSANQKKFNITENYYEKYMSKHGRIIQDLVDINTVEKGKKTYFSTNPTFQKRNRNIFPQRYQNAEHIVPRTQYVNPSHYGMKNYTIPPEDPEQDRERVSEGLVPMETTVIMEEMLEEGMSSCTIA